MWLFIPSNSAPEAGCSARECEPGSDTWASRIAPSATLSGKLTQPQSWSRAWKKAAWMLLLSGPTLSLSTADASVDTWIGSLPASLAKTSPSLVRGLGSTGREADCSFGSLTLPMLTVRGDSFWRTSAASFLPPPPLWTKQRASSKNARPPASWENWPIAGGMRSGCIYLRPTLARATGATDGSASLGEWPTPTAMNAQGNDYTRDRGQIGQERLTLAGRAKAWPTPTGGEGGPNSKRDQRGNVGANLKEAALQWPTPNARDHKGQDLASRNGGSSLAHAQTGVFSHSSPQAPTTPVGAKSWRKALNSLHRLNPLFVAWLMGWTSTWTIAAPHASSLAATVLWRRRLALQLSNFYGDRD